MNVKIGTDYTQILFRAYINGDFVAVCRPKGVGCATALSLAWLVSKRMKADWHGSWSGFNFYSPLEQNLVCNANIVYGNLKSENSQDYAQKPQRNCTFMNLASGSRETIWEYPFLSGRCRRRGRYSIQYCCMLIVNGILCWPPRNRSYISDELLLNLTAWLYDLLAAAQERRCFCVRKRGN